MNAHECSGCGKFSCDGRCFDECPADYAEGITLDELRARYALLDLSVKTLAGERIEQKPLGEGWHRWAA